jgi:superfamily II DNA or RNA helicase
MSQDKREEIQEAALQEIVKHYRCTAAISMRVGKCKIGLDRINLLYQINPNIKVLIAAPQISIYKSWIEDAKKFGLEHLIPCITFTTYKSLNLEKRTLDYDLLILDENHSILASNVPWLSGFKGMILGLTGTPPKNKESFRAKLIKIYCPIVFEYYINDAVNDHILNDYRVIVHLIPISSEKNLKVKMKNGGVFTTSEQDSYNYWSSRITLANFPLERQKASIMRMKTMQTFPSKTKYAKKLLEQIEEKCLVFANTGEQADELCKHSYHSKNKNSKENLELFQNDEIDKMSCIAQISQGVTFNKLGTVLVLHSYSNEKNLAQRIGRALSLKPDEMATIHILAYKDTCDANIWVPLALEGFDKTKIKYVEFN